MHLFELGLPGLLFFPKWCRKIESVFLEQGEEVVEAVAEQVDAMDDELVLLLVELVLIFVVEGQVSLRLVVPVESWILWPDSLVIIAVHTCLRRPVVLLIDLVPCQIDIFKSNMRRAALLYLLYYAILYQILCMVLDHGLIYLVLQYVHVCGHRLRRYHLLRNESFSSFVCLIFI